jgi:colicin import membrane protein
MYNLSKENQK